MRTFRRLLLCCAIVPCAALAQSASTPAGTPNPSVAGRTQSDVAPLEITFVYSYLRSNANPGQCGCFNMNGGNVEGALHLYRGFSAPKEFSGENTASVNNGGRGLSLVSFAAGPRFSFSFHRKFAPFAQDLFGVAHGFQFLLSGLLGHRRRGNWFCHDCRRRIRRSDRTALGDSPH